MEKEYVTWEDVERFVDHVDFNLRTKHQISGVYGLPRGGLVLAVMISHYMNIPLLMSPADNCIIVDDICDSGESLIHYTKNSSGDNPHDYYIATMYYKPNSLVRPDTWYSKKSDKWIVFPWEEFEI